MAALEKGSGEGALYVRLMAHIRERIIDGTLPPGTQIPPELQLAEEHQVSRGTVRQAMTGLVNEGLLERIRGRGTFVRTAPSKDYYSPTMPAAKRIGVLLANASGEIDLLVLIGIESAAKLRGYQISFGTTEEDVTQQAEGIAWLRADRVGGMVIFPIRDSAFDESIWQLKAHGIPFVLVDRYFPDLDCDYVSTDNKAGGYRATEHLIILGHTRIGFAHSYIGTPTTTSVSDRLTGYRQALQDYGLSYDESLVFKECHLSESSDPFHEMLLRPDRPTAVFTSNDQTALSLIQSAQRNGIRIPQDLAVVGYDNLRFSARLSPPLTTVAQSFSDMGVQAANLLINRIEGLGGPSRHIELSGSLIIRESCGARLRLRAATTSISL